MILEEIKGRKSVRAYSDKKVENWKLMEVLEAGILAPSARNMQRWKFLVIRDRQVRAKMVDACNGQEMVGQADINLVMVATDGSIMNSGQPTAQIDLSIALSYMMLQAERLGLSTCWLGNFNASEVKKLANIPSEYEVIAVSPLGYGAEEGRIRDRKPFDEVVVFEKM